MNVKSYVFIICLTFIGFHGALIGQKPKDYGIKSSKALNFYMAGKKQIEYRDHLKAMEYLAQAIALEPEFTDAHFHYTYAAHLRGKLSSAEKSLLHLALKDIPNYYGARLWYADLQMDQVKYQEAKKWYIQYLNTEPEDAKEVARAQVNIRKCTYAEQAVRKPVPFKPINLGTGVNSQGDEYMPILTADGSRLFFTSRRPGNLGGFNARLNDFGEDFYYSDWKDGAWSEAKNFGPPINTSDNEGAACFSQDGRLVYFTGCNRPDGLGECDIYVARNDGKTWSQPQNLGLGINSSNYETQPWLSHDGKTLYFVSTRKGGLGGTDIWYSDWEDGKWSQPRNMGMPVNTAGNEYSPMLHASDAVLYFSSDYHDGFGGMDIFYVNKTDMGWGEVQNIGYPINTSAHERFIFVTSDGKTAYYSSDRLEGGFGRNDLFSFALAPQIQPPAAVYVRGNVRDSLNGKPLSATVMIVRHADGDTVRTVESESANGRFLLSLPAGSSYGVYVEEQGYLFYSGNFELSESTQNYDLDIALSPVQEGYSLVLRNVFFATASYELLDASRTELDRVVQLMRKNPRMVVEIGGHTDSEGSDTYNQTLSQNRAGSVRQYLIQAGIPAAQVTAKGYGETVPVADNATEAGRALNRRTEFKIIKMQ